jgi:hypothetical protein
MATPLVRRALELTDGSLVRVRRSLSTPSPVVTAPDDATDAADDD